MFDKIEKLRKAPQPVKERLVAVVTIVCVAAITVVWFLFSIHSFLTKTAPIPAPVSTTASTSQVQDQSGTVPIKPPFGQ